MSDASVPLPLPPFSRDFAAAFMSAWMAKRKTGYTVHARALRICSAGMTGNDNVEIRRAQQATLQAMAATKYPWSSHSPGFPASADILHRILQNRKVSDRWKRASPNIAMCTYAHAKLDEICHLRQDGVQPGDILRQS